MIREIKFRVFYEGRFWYFHIGQVWDDQTQKKYFQFCLDGKAFEQFAGLKDKEGVEIYEGDIVHSIHSDADSIVQFGLWEEGNGFYLNGDHTNSGSCNMGYDVHGNLNYLEVIGNIHQNPELLK